MSTSSLASCTSDATTNSTLNGGITKGLLSYDKCPRCGIQFDFLKRVNGSKVPLILNCKHTVCEDCIKRMCTANSTVCPICKEKFSVLRTQIDSLTEVFQPHFSLIGHLVWTKNSSNRKNMNLVSTGFTLGNRQIGSENLPEMNFEIEAKSEDDSDNNENDKTQMTLIFNKCSKHCDQFVNIHCDDCNDTYCCYCFLEEHARHKATYLYKLSEEEMIQMGKLKNDAEFIQAQLLITKKKVEELDIFDSSIIELDIRNYFSDLHARLHLAERNMKKRLLTMDSEETDLDTVTATLNAGIYRVKQFLRSCQLLNTKELNLRALYDEAQAIRDIPCCLVSDQGSLKPIEFVSDNVLDNIEDILSLKALPPIEYSLQPIEDWNEAQQRHDIDAMKRHYESQNQEEQKEVAKIKRPAKKAETETKKVNEGKIRVTVTHLNNLNSFFVQKYSTRESLNEMNGVIGRKRKRRNEEYKIGGIYGVYYETKNSSHWRRGKILDLVSNGSMNYLYRVFFIDYGNTQMVTKEKLKELDIRTVRRSNFALECKLTNPDKLRFETNVHLLLPQLIGQKELYLRYINKHTDRDGIEEVDLLVCASNGGFISVRDLLSKAQLPTSEVHGLVPALKLYENSKKFIVGQEEQVVVTYIKDPSYICVQLVENLKILEKMKKEMKDYYETEPTISCIPMVDTDVVVKYEDEIQGYWHRTRITSVDIPKKQVEVLFMDWGKSAVVRWSDLRRLTENFIKVESQGIILQLAHVDKLELNEPWSKSATDFLREQLGFNEECRMVVSNVNPLEIVLFQLRPGANICVNSLLVEHNDAISSGHLSTTVYWPNMITETEEDDDFSFQMIKKSEDFLIEDDDDFHLKTTIKPQISVMNFKNPDLIYIKFTKDKDREDEMHKNLQIHYGSGHKNKTQKSWKPRDYCVVFDSRHNNYFRAVIKTPSDVDNYIVYLFDHVRELKVSKNKIFQLDTYFKMFKCNVYKCRLANIRQAGDGGTWSNLAVEILQKIFANYKTLHIKKLEINQEDQMFGVIMWYCLTTPAKALEPSKVKYISINRSLIVSGVAFGIPTAINTTSLAAKKPIIDENRHFIIETEMDLNNEFQTSKSIVEKPCKKQDWNDMICKDEEMITTQENWLEPCKVQKREFDAVLTCVSSDGSFFVRDKDMQDFYMHIEENASSTFNSLETSEKVEWRINDMCTISYEGRWYRGTVLEVLNDNVINVEMIDFGSEHVVSKNQLTQYIMFPNFPRTVYKIRLYDVQSNYGQWTADDVNQVLDIVTEHVKVVIKGDLQREVPLAEIYLDDGRNINDLITIKCPHMVRCEKLTSQSTVEFIDSNDAFDDEEKDIDTKSDEIYTYVPPKILTGKQKMFIVNVLKWDTSYKVVLSNLDSHKNPDDFTSLNDDIQEHINAQPELENIQLDKPCICLHPQKNLWSRAQVYNVDSLKFGYILAFFVDYGSVEIVPKSQVKQMRSEWFNPPIHMKIAFINIELLESNQAEYVLLQLNNLRGKSALVETVSEKPLKVHLYDGKRFYYQDFVDCGVVQAL